MNTALPKHQTNQKIMKKIFIAIALVIFLSLGGYFFSKARRSKVLPSQAEIGNSADPIALNSFRGVVDLTFERPVVQANSDNASENISPQTDSEKKEDVSDSESGEGVFTFAILGDTQYFDAGNPQGNFQKAARNISKMNSDIVIAVGDLISSCEDHCAQKFSDWKNVMGGLLGKTYAAQGNHDRFGNNSADSIWQNAFSLPVNGPTGFLETTYSFDFKNSHFVFLSSDNPDEHQVNQIQRSWLEQDLAKNTKENTFVIFHEPAYPVSGKGGEGLDAQPSERNALWEILDRNNVTAVFNGHEHIVSRRKIDSRVSSVAKNSVYQFVFGNTDSFDHGLPAAGVAEYSNQGQGRFGFVKVNGKEITVETYGPNETLLNTFTFSK
jgi:predicted phosphodiesterase